MIKGMEYPVAITEVFLPITFFIKSLISCSYKLFVYVSEGLSESPYPNKSNV